MPNTEINGCRIHYDYLERRPGAPTLIFLNGIMSANESWDGQLAVAERLGCNVLRHEYRGQWRSDVPPGPYSLRQHADDLAALMDQLRIERGHLVGISYGGFVGMRFALDRPSRAQSLMLISTAARLWPVSAAMVANWRRFAATDDVGLLFQAMIPDIYAERVLRDQPELPGQRLAGLVAATRGLPDFCRGQVALLDTLLRDLAGEGIGPELGDIRCPTLVVAGELERLYPPVQAADIAARIPGADYVVVPNAGHAVVAERPSEINLLLAGHLARA